MLIRKESPSIVIIISQKQSEEETGGLNTMARRDLKRALEKILKQ